MWRNAVTRVCRRLLAVYRLCIALQSETRGGAGRNRTPAIPENPPLRAFRRSAVCWSHDHRSPQGGSRRCSRRFSRMGRVQERRGAAGRRVARALLCRLDRLFLDPRLSQKCRRTPRSGSLNARVSSGIEVSIIGHAAALIDSRCAARRLPGRPNAPTRTSSAARHSRREAVVRCVCIG